MAETGVIRDIHASPKPTFEIRPCALSGLSEKYGFDPFLLFDGPKSD
jgi:hypothetical protein